MSSAWLRCIVNETELYDRGRGHFLNLSTPRRMNFCVCQCIWPSPNKTHHTKGAAGDRMGDTAQVEREVEHLKVVIGRLGSAQADGKGEKLFTDLDLSV